VILAEQPAPAAACLATAHALTGSQRGQVPSVEWSGKE